MKLLLAEIFSLHLICVSGKTVMTGPGEMYEACEGDNITFQCPAGQTLVFGDTSHLRWGRNDEEWEPRTACKARGQEDVSHCTTKDVKQKFLKLCQGKSKCKFKKITLKYKSGREPCPPRAGEKTHLNYLIVKYSCEPSRVDNTTTTTTTITPTDTPEEDIYTNRNILFQKLDEIDGINEETERSVTEFFEKAFVSIQKAKNNNESQTSLLNITEAVSKKLMEMLESQENITSLEIKTSQLTLKLVKKKFSERSDSAAVTEWQSGGREVSLPDQRELLAGEGGDSLEVMMAAYDNLQAGMNSASDVISVSTSASQSVNLSKPVTFLLEHHGDKKVSCAFWSFRLSSWSREGCETVCHNDTHTKCQCQHLTNFALIFNVHQEFIASDGFHAHQLKYITYVGFSISIFSMVLTIVVFLLQSRSHTTKRDIIHVNLCLSLLTAEVIFMFGITETANSLYCSLISILLHYFFLASFAWMFLEGYQIYELLVKVFETSNNSQAMHYMIGYCIPTLIVIISLVIDYARVYTVHDTEDMCFDPLLLSSYGTVDYCWLALDNNFVLSFIIPAVLVIISNVAMLLFAVHTMMANKTRSDSDLILNYMKGVGVLMCLLGSTWIFGLLLLAFNNLFIAYAFTILNSLQGVGIFVFQCLLNPQTKRVLKKMICCVSDSRKKYQRTNTVEMSDVTSVGAKYENQNDRVSYKPVPESDC